MNTMYESYELKPVGPPALRYAVKVPPFAGYWATFTEDGKTVGYLVTDSDKALYFQGVQGHDALSSKGTHLVQTCAAMKYSVQDGFTTVKELLEEQDNLTSETTYGLVPVSFVTDSGEYFLGTNENDEVVSLIDMETDPPRVRVAVDWETPAPGDSRIEDVSLHSVTEDAVDIFDSGETSLDAYAEVLLDDQ